MQCNSCENWNKICDVLITILKIFSHQCILLLSKGVGPISNTLKEASEAIIFFWIVSC